MNIKKIKNLVLIWYVVGKSVNNIPRNKNSMNQKIKQAGLFAILAVFTISLTTSFVGDAEASPQSRGDITSEQVEPSIKAQQRAQSPSIDPVNTGDPVWETPEPSIKAQQKANVEVETEPEAPRSESNQKRPAGETPEPSIKAQQRAQALDQ